MIGKQKSSIWKAPRMEQKTTTCGTGHYQYITPATVLQEEKEM